MDKFTLEAQILNVFFVKIKISPSVHIIDSLGESARSGESGIDLNQLSVPAIQQGWIPL
jgi:hypothetical protein